MLALIRQSPTACNRVPDSGARVNPDSGTISSWGSNRSRFLGSEKPVGNSHVEIAVIAARVFWPKAECAMILRIGFLGACA